MLYEYKYRYKHNYEYIYIYDRSWNGAIPTFRWFTPLSRLDVGKMVGVSTPGWTVRSFGDAPGEIYVCARRGWSRRGDPGRVWCLGGHNLGGWKCLEVKKNTWNAVSLDVISIMMSIMVYFVGTVFALLGCMLMHLLGMRGSGFQGMIHYHPSWQTYTNEWMFAIYVPSFFGMSPTIVQWLPCVLIIWCSEVWVSGGAQGKSRIRWPMGAFSPWRQELT